MTPRELPPRPMGNVVGRQPDMVKITPSRSQPWIGAIIPGQRFTAQQLAALSKASLHPDDVERMTVRRNATHEEYYWGTRDLPPVFEFECPVLSRRADGRVRVIAPSGEGKLVYADGWNTPDKRKGARR